MVDALRDVWRVLVDGGTLLDLRPLPRDYRLELVTADAAIPIGQTDTTGRAQDDAAADAAVAQVVDERLFASRSRVEFNVEIFWDTVRDLKCYMATRETTRVTPSYEELERAYQSATGGSNARARLRTTRRVMLAAFGRRERRRR
ncbi:MAG: hypothetical protein ACRD09_06565 [Vicinamibacterales bacterium]